MEIEITKEQEAKNIGKWLIEFGSHILENPNVVIDGTINYEPTGDTLLNSPVSYENACKISFVLVKKAG